MAGIQGRHLAQAVIFALIHIFVFFDDSTPFLLDIMLVAFALGLGWLAGWLNEGAGEGSILPGWLAHAGANTVTYLGATYVC